MLTQGRKLDSGNPNPGNLGSDFNRFGLDFWAVVDRLDVRNPDRRGALLIQSLGVAPVKKPRRRKAETA